jgi:5-(carboxyamino)imidazole ribonucleotide synthase
MLSEALERLATDAVILEPDVLAPCHRRRAGVVARPIDDPEALRTFFNSVEVATFDSENIPATHLAPYAQKLTPSLEILETTQHRVAEKTFLAQNHFQPVAFVVVDAGRNLSDAVEAFGYPCILKSVLGGYDGKGQFKLNRRSDVDAVPQHPPRPWILEETITLRSEISCIVARSDSSAFTFPVFENLHANHVLDFTLLPARVSEQFQMEARTRALAIAEALRLRGLLTVEFFIGTGRDGVERLFVNELAPRVHNSGHVTRQACTSSQFDVLARILSGVPVHEPTVHSGAWCMGQLLGEVWLSQGRPGGALKLDAWADFPDVREVYLYGKQEARRGRKMGHFIVQAATADEALSRAREFRARLEQR